MDKIFCKNCGKSIDDNSKFCSFCGFQIIENEIVLNDSLKTAQSISNEVPVKTLQKSLNDNKIIGLPKTIFGFLSLWIILNFIFLMINWSTGDVERFWPFFDEYGRSYVEFDDYDLSEFLVYTIVPVSLAYIFTYVFKGKKDVQS